MNSSMGSRILGTAAWTLVMNALFFGSRPIFPSANKYAAARKMPNTRNSEILFGICGKTPKNCDMLQFAGIFIGNPSIIEWCVAIVGQNTKPSTIAEATANPKSPWKESVWNIRFIINENKETIHFK